MRTPFSEADDRAMVSFYTQCERLMSKGTVDGYSITRKADSATLEIFMGGAVLTGTGPTIAEALTDIGKALVDAFPSGEPS
jgi:hypothetical protein